MARPSEDVFIKEFQSTVRTLANRSNLSVKDLCTPNPLEGTGMLTELPSYDTYEVEGFPEDDPFYGLNGTEVVGLGKGASKIEPERFVIDRTGKRKKDLYGNFVTKSFSASAGSIVVRTDRRVNVPRKYDGLQSNCYVTTMLEEDYPGVITDERRLLYMLTKDNLYLKYPAALAISSRKMPNYQGYRIQTWNFGVVNMVVIPYVPGRTYIDTEILAVKFSIDFYEEMSHIVNTFVHEGLIPNPDHFSVADGYENLVYRELTPNYTDYVGVSPVPISDKGSLSYVESAKMSYEGSSGSFEEGSLDDSWEDDFKVDNEGSDEGYPNEESW